MTVDYSLATGTAVVGADVYDNNTSLSDPLSGTITFPANSTSQTIGFYVPQDGFIEPDESFFLNLFNPLGAEFGGADQSLQTVGWVLDGNGEPRPLRSRTPR